MKDFFIIMGVITLAFVITMFIHNINYHVDKIKAGQEYYWVNPNPFDNIDTIFVTVTETREGWIKYNTMAKIDSSIRTIHGYTDQEDRFIELFPQKVK